MPIIIETANFASSHIQVEKPAQESNEQKFKREEDEQMFT